MKKTLKTLKYVDWILGIGTILAGIVMGSKLIVGAGLLGLLVAWYNPAERVKQAIEKRMVRKGSSNVDHTAAAKADDALYEGTEPAAVADVASPTAETPNYSANPTTGKVYLHSSPHNLVKLTSLSFSHEGKTRDWA